MRRRVVKAVLTPVTAAIWACLVVAVAVTVVPLAIARWAITGESQEPLLMAVGDPLFDDFWSWWWQP